MRKGLLSLALAATASLMAPSAMAAEGDIIVGFKGETSIRGFQNLGLGFKKVISDELNIALLEPQFTVLDTKKLVEILRSYPEVAWAQLDHPVTMREVIPDDPDFARQWSLRSQSNNSDIRATYAWTLGKGGKTIEGEDVVVAVVDQGVDWTHPSLAANMWVNTAEIDGNKIDDDGNGYVDDIYGWDAVRGQGQIFPGDHGTHVAGIIGARGNDGLQVVGVNWESKIMSVRVLGYGDKDLTSTVLEGYNYVLKQKKMWLESEGKAGANVVATNSSFGVDYARCDSGDYPAWNAVYEAMGQVGILSAAATINGHVDVDVRGDVPTTCQSDFIVSVTNTTETGTKNSGAGYGAVHIDLGAPGTNVLSTVTKGLVRNMTGTSMATPHVAGAIAFLHSVASQDFRRLYRESPAEAALKIKRAMLESVTVQQDLVGRTVSGGRLNLHGAAVKLTDFSLSAQ
jgi:subtilisin family serine protease